MISGRVTGAMWSTPGMDDTDRAGDAPSERLGDGDVERLARAAGGDDDRAGDARQAVRVQAQQRGIGHGAGTGTCRCVRARPGDRASTAACPETPAMKTSAAAAGPSLRRGRQGAARHVGHVRWTAGGASGP